MTISKDSIIGAIVASDYRMAGLFQQQGIDFCCKGNRSVEEACREQQIDSDLLVQKLLRLQSGISDSTGIDYKSWPIDLLADFIEKKHHRYVREQIPVITAFLEKIVRVHGAGHPELKEIKELFEASAAELTTHMKKEELIVFPSVRQLLAAKQAVGTPATAAFGSIANPIRVMMSEHDGEGERFRRISALSNRYAAPEDACNTYRAAYAALKAFEEDLHLHIHLENNILFPASLELEASFIA